MKTIIFKKHLLGRWIRDDGELTKHVNEESMFREIAKLVDDGWKLNIHGEAHVRRVEVFKD